MKVIEVMAKCCVNVDNMKYEAVARKRWHPTYFCIWATFFLTCSKMCF
jgi:hypothetical protein